MGGRRHPSDFTALGSRVQGTRAGTIPILVLYGGPTLHRIKVHNTYLRSVRISFLKFQLCSLIFFFISTLFHTVKYNLAGNTSSRAVWEMPG